MLIPFYGSGNYGIGNIRCQVVDAGTKCLPNPQIYEYMCGHICMYMGKVRIYGHTYPNVYVLIYLI